MSVTSSAPGSVVLGKHRRSPPRPPRSVTLYSVAEEAEEWRGLSSDDNEEDASDDAVHQLPRNAPSKWRTLFSALVNGELGPAEFVEHEWSNQIVGVQSDPRDTRTKEVWVVDGDLWLLKSMPAFRLVVQARLILALKPLHAYVKRNRIDFQAVDPKGPGFKAWMSYEKKVEAANTRFTSERGICAITNILFDKILDNSFPARLNAARDILSFQNGVLNLRTMVLRPRTYEDCLSYFLPYDFDPAADITDITTFVTSLYENEEAARSFRTTAGYWITGQTCIKSYWQVTAPPHSGKTTLSNALMSAGGKYFSKDVPIKEMSVKCEFEDGFAHVLNQAVPVRGLFWDETPEGMEVKEPLLNMLSDGKEMQAARFNRKHMGSVPTSSQYHAKIVFFSNHPLRFSLGAHGTSARCRGVGLSFTFPEVFNPSDPQARPRNSELCARLESGTVAAKQGIMKWLVLGAYDYYQGVSMTCPLFDDSTFKLQVLGDPYLAWLCDKYLPNGRITSPDSRYSLDDLVKEYVKDRHDPATNGRAHQGLKTVLDSMSDYISCDPWELFGYEVKGYTGLRLRKPGDMDWNTARSLARKAAAAIRLS